MQPLILDLNFWHRSFLTIIMVENYPLCEFLHAAKLSVALCYVALASSPRHQHLLCFHCAQQGRRQRGGGGGGGKGGSFPPLAFSDLLKLLICTCPMRCGQGYLMRMLTAENKL